MRTISITLIFALCWATLAFGTPYGDQIIETAKSYSYVREQTNHNDAPQIDGWMKYLGLDNAGQIRSTGTGFSWCMGFVQGMYREVYAIYSKRVPLPRSARVSDVYKMAKKDKYRYQVFTAKQVESGAVKLKVADVMICSHNKRTDNFDGHTGLVIAQNSKAYFRTIEGNTGPSSNANDQREQTGTNKKVEMNGGVRFKDRTVRPRSPTFCVEGFIRTLDKS
jgi:hypothetical protein